MKYLVLLAVIFAVLWFVRNNRRDDTPSSSAGAAPRRGAPPVQQEMVECPVCKVHLPRTDALPGPGGRLYCCTEHVRKG
jgi:uncharacterized protein